MPHVTFFTELTPELKTPWLTAMDPADRARHQFRDRAILGLANMGKASIWLNLDCTDDGFIDTVAHEVAHTAGYDELQARAFGQRALRQIRGGHHG